MSLAFNCYHCGLPVPSKTHWYVRIDQQERPMCCAGCAAVAQAIVAEGLTDYYRHRDALPESPREAIPLDLQTLSLFDHPATQKEFVRECGDNEKEVDLILEGITCAACVWLNERHLTQLSGVTAVAVNYATQRARVRWDEAQIKLSTILESIRHIGYRATPYDAARSEQAAQRERRTALWRLLVAGFGMMQVMMYAWPAYVAKAGEMTSDIALLMRWASLLLTLPVVFYSAAPFFQRAWRDLKLRRLGMDVPVALGVGCAFVASVWATVTSSGEVYFDSVTMFVFFLLGGRYLEMLARQRAVRGAENLARVVPAFAARVRDGVTEQVPVASLQLNDVIQIKPGETIPVDGNIVAGVSEVDESWLSGESRPIAKKAPDEVQAGSINRVNPLTVSVRKVGAQTRIAAIAQLMQRAAGTRPRVVELADKWAAYFIAALLVLALVTGLVWWQIDSTRALWIFVSVLVVSCPCAFSLATPVVLTVATDTLARMGLLVTRAHAIETLARAQHFVFDKTGTLTTGQMHLQQIACVESISTQQALAYAAALEAQVTHPLAQAVMLAAQDVDHLTATNVQAQVGLGVQGEIDGVIYRVGQAQYVRQIVGAELAPALNLETAEAASQIFLACQNQWLACLSFSDNMRDHAVQLMQMLSQRKLGLSLFSGDDQAPVRRVADLLAIPDAHARMSPEEKHAALTALQKDKIVAMVGDGINDAPVLAQAHVSIAMGAASELTRNNADIILLDNNLAKLAQGRRLAEKTLRIIRQNLVWSAAYNFCAIPAAMFGWMTPWMAGLGMSLSSFLVVLNALRLRRINSI